MLKLVSLKVKTHCKGDIRSSKTANIILPGLTTNIGECPYVYKILFNSPGAEGGLVCNHMSPNFDS